MENQNDFISIKNKALNFINGKSNLKNTLEKDIENWGYLIELIIHDIENDDKKLADGDNTKIIKINSLLPFYYLRDEYEDFEEFLEWYIILIQNYGVMIFEKNKDVLDSLKSIVVLLQTKNNFNRLIYCSEILIKEIDYKKDKINSPYASLQISKMYLENVFGVK